MSLFYQHNTRFLDSEDLEEHPDIENPEEGWYFSDGGTIYGPFDTEYDSMAEEETYFECLALDI